MRGRTFTAGPLKLHTTSLVTGAVTVVVGWLMIFTNGMASIPELLPSNWITSLESLGRGIDAAVPSWVWTLGVGILLLLWWLREAMRRSAADNSSAAPSPENPDPAKR
jgi:hypothetical protein